MAAVLRTAKAASPSMTRTAEPLLAAKAMVVAHSKGVHAESHNPSIACHQITADWKGGALTSIMPALQRVTCTARNPLFAVALVNARQCRVFAAQPKTAIAKTPWSVLSPAGADSKMERA